MSKYILLTHNDLDGVGPSALLKYLLSKPEVNGKLEEVFYTPNGKVEETIDTIISKYGTKGYKLLITDHSPVKEYHEKMINERIDFSIYDHHKSSEIQSEEGVYFDVTKSATKIFFEHFYPEEYKKEVESFVFHVNDYDMWIHESNHSKRLNELLYETSISSFVSRFSKDPSTDFTATEEMLVSNSEKKRDKYIERAIESAELFKDSKGLDYAVIFAETNQSELGHKALGTLGVSYVFMVNPQSSKVSIRSLTSGEKEADSSLVAYVYASILHSNSGGHKGAAGFTYKKEQLTTLYKLLTQSI